MKNVFKDIRATAEVTFVAFWKLFKFYFIPNHDVMSEEARKIFSNDEDRKKYIDAAEYLKHRRGETREIELSTKEKITLMS